MTDNAAFTVVIQAGGRSTRMGQDKALMPFLGQPLIAREVERLRQLNAGICIIANEPDRYAFLGLPIFTDLLPGAGPLGGLFTAFSVIEAPVVAVIACDMPFVMPELLDAQRALLVQEGADLVIPRSPEGRQPLHCVYRRDTCLPAVQAALESGERKMIAWFHTVRVREMSVTEVAAIGPDFRSFINVNSPEEFTEAEQQAQRLEGR